MVKINNSSPISSTDAFTMFDIYIRIFVVVRANCIAIFFKVMPTEENMGERERERQMGREKNDKNNKKLCNIGWSNIIQSQRFTKYGMCRNRF